MNFLHSEVDVGDGGTIVVDLEGTEANVLVMDTPNFNSYRNGRRYRYFGGHFRASPAMVRPPGAGRWHVIVDLGGRRGQVRAAVRVMS